MEIIDIHTHIYPDDIAQKATDSVQAFYGIGEGTMNGTTSMLLSQGDAAGISRFVTLPVAIRPDRVQSINDYMAGEQAKQPRFIGFGTVHAAMEGITDEVRRIESLGLHGIKMHPDSQRFAIDDARLYPMYEEARGRLPVLLHMGDHRYDYSHPIKLRRILDQFPGLTVIAAHLGGYSMYETAHELLLDTDCVLDVSSALKFLSKDEARRYVNSYGPERLAFGSDYPMWDPVKEVRRFLELELPLEQTEQIAAKTAKRILKLD